MKSAHAQIRLRYLWWMQPYVEYLYSPPAFSPLSRNLSVGGDWHRRANRMNLYKNSGRIFQQLDYCYSAIEEHKQRMETILYPYEMKK